MDSTDQKLASYTSSSAILIMRRSLRASGWWSIFWGCFWLIILLIEIGAKGAGNIHLVTYLWLGLGGFLLLAEGIFVMRTFNSTALMAEALTLGILGALNLLSFVQAMTSHGGGRANPLYGAIMLYNGFMTWKARNAVAELMSKTTEQDLEFVTRTVEHAATDDPNNSPDIVEFKTSGIVKENPEWRMKVVDGIAFLVNLRSVFGKGKRPIQILVMPVRSVQFDITGETWIGSKTKCRLTINGQPTDKKFEIERNMLEKVQMCGATASASAIG